MFSMPMWNEEGIAFMTKKQKKKKKKNTSKFSGEDLCGG